MMAHIKKLAKLTEAVRATTLPARRMVAAIAKATESFFKLGRKASPGSVDERLRRGQTRFSVFNSTDGRDQI